MRENTGLSSACCRVGIALAVCGASVFALSGCVFSGTVTEVIYEQDENNPIDYDVDPVYVSSPDAELTSDDLPADAVTAEGSKEVTDGSPTTEGDTEVDSDSDASSDEEDESSDSNSNKDQSKKDSDGGNQKNKDSSSSLYSDGEDDADKSGSTGSGDDAQQDNSTDSGDDSDSGSGTTSGDSSDGDGDSSSGGNSGESTEGGGKASGDADAGADDDGKSNSGKSAGEVFNYSGASSSVPEGVDTVAAVGNAAILTAVLGGADGAPNLVAADSELLGSTAKSILSSRGIGDAAVGWSSDGDSKDADIDTLVKLAPDAVLVTENENTLTDAQIEKLTAVGTNIVYVPAMSTPAKTLACVERVGEMLKKGGDTKAASLASSYSDFYNDAMSGDYKGSSTSYTLYINDWNTSASYSGSSQRVFSGVAFAPVGSNAQPLGKYLEAAGVVNVGSNKARYTALGSTATAIMWPLSGGGTDDSEWNGISKVNGGLLSDDNAFGMALTQITNNSSSIMLGSSAYSSVLTMTDSQKESLESNRDTANGLYSPSSSGLSGNDSKSSVVGDYDVIVNPHGVFSSWADGSLESPLETIWAFKTLQNGDVNVKSKIKDFYSTFYGYSLSSSEIDDILDGSYAQD